MLMLFIHLSTLTGISFVPMERAGVLLKKVCLKKETKKQLLAPTAKTFISKQLLNKVPDTKNKSEEGTVEVLCSVKLLCTAAADNLIFIPLYPDFEKSGFDQSSYYSPGIYLEPDPPRLS
ncbi:hypothetical protein [Botryobacter ruber]|uniref:hypothetical protein n=1 Tax=Botryobacter ruber TaxID=2171629 RepID=UPI000E0A350A|nr:hypothetical protein [Botryobacter ruber]